MKVKLQQLNITQSAILTYALELFAKEREKNIDTCKKHGMNPEIREEELATGKALALAIEHGEVIIISYQYPGGEEKN